MDPATFRGNFPEFASTTTYPDAQVQFWITVATNRLDPGAWGALLDLGTQLLVAHNLVSGARAAKTTAFGGIPGATVGVQTAKAVDKVSASYDAASTTIEGAGNWNATDYGVRFYQLAEQMGGGLQL